MDKELLQRIKKSLPTGSCGLIAQRLGIYTNAVTEVLRHGTETRHANAVIIEALAIIKASQEEKARLESIASNLLNQSSDGNN